MPLKLVIAGIPPVASHMGALLIGIAMANLGVARMSTDSSGTLTKLPPHYLAASLPNVVPRGLEDVRIREVHVVRVQGNGGCRLSGTPLKLLRRLPVPLVATAATNAGDLMSAAVGGSALQLVPAPEAATVAACEPASKVTYGQ